MEFVATKDNNIYVSDNITEPNCVYDILIKHNIYYDCDDQRISIRGNLVPTDNLYNSPPSEWKFSFHRPDCLIPNWVDKKLVEEKVRIKALEWLDTHTVKKDCNIDRNCVGLTFGESSSRIYVLGKLYSYDKSCPSVSIMSGAVYVSYNESSPECYISGGVYNSMDKSRSKICLYDGYSHIYDESSHIIIMTQGSHIVHSCNENSIIIMNGGTCTLLKESSPKVIMNGGTCSIHNDCLPKIEKFNGIIYNFDSSDSTRIII